MTRQREGAHPVAGQRFSGCADAITATEGRSPLAPGLPRRLMAANYFKKKSRRVPVGGSGSRPAIMNTFGDMPVPCWGWLKPTREDMIVLGRPLTVRRGDLLHIEATPAEPAMIFLVLDEFYPVRFDDALCLLGYELDAGLRVIGRREVYLKHPDGSRAQYPMWGTYRREAKDFGDEDGDDVEGGGDD